ncbi:MAG: hypothetical protein ACD_84C00026G0002 [uncultured bacterium]|nr:MAG: hypothetical protein ACD_84C00026G0002 [uncultured bacterium]
MMPKKHYAPHEIKPDTRRDDLIKEVALLTKDRDHWKSNHDNQVQRARILIERTDTPLERTNAYAQIGELLTEKELLKARVKHLEQELQTIRSWYT